MWRSVAVQVLAIVACSFAAACTVKFTYKKAGYDDREIKTVKRIMLAVEPRTGVTPGIRGMLLRMQRDFLSTYRGYIIRPDPSVGVNAQGRQRICTANPGLDAVLWTKVRSLKLMKDEALLGLQLTLYACKNNDRLWDIYGESTYDTNSDDYASLRATYRKEFGDSVRASVQGFYQLTRLLLEDIPNPELTRKERFEKIQNLK